MEKELRYRLNFEKQEMYDLFTIEGGLIKWLPRRCQGLALTSCLARNGSTRTRRWTTRYFTSHTSAMGPVYCLFWANFQ